MHARVPVAHIYAPAGRDVRIAGLRGERYLRAWIDQPPRRRRYPAGNLLRRESILNVEDAYTGVVVGGENQFITLKGAGAVLVQVVGAEYSCRAIVAIVRRGQRRDRDRIFRFAHVDDERAKGPLRALFGVGLVGDDGEPAAGQ